ncbi:MAG: ribonuclease T, partial [Thiohalomonadales bacterium]
MNPPSNIHDHEEKLQIAQRFRGFLPVIIDVETAGFNAASDALLEIAAVIVDYDSNGDLEIQESIATHVKPFAGATFDKASLDFIGIDPHHPLRIAQEEPAALKRIFDPIREKVRTTKCTRAILVGHNPSFDLSFIKSAVERNKIKKNPFHQFSTFDTATLGGLAYGQTVLARAVQTAGIEWDNKSAHSARYDAEKTA